jgi:hypothetical protein
MSKPRKPQPDWLTQSYVRHLFDYNLETGVLTWRIQRGHMRPGDIAGTLSSNGYYSVNFIDGGQFLNHTLIWLWMTGDYPKQSIDHNDRNTLNNAWINLRLVPNYVNSLKGKTPISNTSGVKGVHFSKKQGKWTARVQHRTGCVMVKTCDSFEHACIVVKELRAIALFCYTHRAHLAEIQTRFARIRL